MSQEHGRGKPVRARPALKYILIRRKSKGHGHLAVYRVTAKQIDILHVFHSAQDWELKLAKEPQA